MFLSTTPSEKMTCLDSAIGWIISCMSAFQRNALFTGLLVLILMVCGFGLKMTMDAHTRAVAVQAQQEADRKTAWKKDNIRQLKSLSGIGALSTDEQTRVDNAGNDLDRLQQVLLDIHQERITFWESQMKDVSDRRRKLSELSEQITYDPSGEVRQASEKITDDFQTAGENILGYKAAMVKIHAWRPSDYSTYNPKKQLPEDFEPEESKPSAAVPAVLHQASASVPEPQAYPSVVTPSDESGISAAIATWRNDLLSNNPQVQAKPYASSMDRYFLASNWSNQQVEQYLAKLDAEGSYDKLDITNLNLRSLGSDSVEATFTKNFAITRKGVTTEASVRGVLHFVREGGAWKVNYERDFKS